MVLEFVSTQPPTEARAFLGEMAHIFNAIFSALRKRESRLRQRARRLAGTGRRQGRRPCRWPPEEPLDESWAEPVVFDGC